MTTTKQKHTPGPWRIVAKRNTHDNTITIQTTEENYAKRSSICYVAPQPHYADNQFANAARIVACVNACEGFSTEFITQGCIAEGMHLPSAVEAMRAENARLREALKQCVNEEGCLGMTQPAKYGARRLSAITEIARDALRLSTY